MTDYTTPELQPYLTLATEIMRHVYGEEDPTELNKWLSEQVAKLGGAKDENAIMTWEESFDFYDELLQKRIELAKLPADQRKLFDWPWATWNKLIDPMEFGMLAAITAGDGQGKTIVAECLGEYWAKRGHHVVFVHYELNRGVMLDRRAARQTGIDRRTLKSADFHAGDLAQVKEMRNRLSGWGGSITYLHTPGWTMERTVSALRSLKADGHCDVVLIDYLEKAAGSTRQIKLFGGNAFQREADNVEQLKNFGEATDTPMVMLNQMSKAGKTGNFDKLDRTAMRGAGEKSEKANIVIMLHREKIDGEYSRIVDVMVDKNTLGATGTFTQIMVPERFDIADIAKESTR